MRKYVCLAFIVSLFSICTFAKDKTKGKEITIIKQLIEKENNALNRDHNLDEYMSCFAKSDKVQSGPSNDKMTIGYDAIKASAEQVIQGYNGKSNLNTWSYADWDVRLNGKSAFATCVQSTKTPQGGLIKVLKSDYLEKVKGEWKIFDHRYFHTPERKE